MVIHRTIGLFLFYALTGLIYVAKTVADPSGPQLISYGFYFTFAVSILFTVLYIYMTVKAGVIDNDPHANTAITVMLCLVFAAIVGTLLILAFKPEWIFMRYYNGG